MNLKESKIRSGMRELNDPPSTPRPRRPQAQTSALCDKTVVVSINKIFNKAKVDLRAKAYIADLNSCKDDSLDNFKLVVNDHRRYIFNVYAAPAIATLSWAVLLYLCWW